MIPQVLSIAGSDSGGGAGIQADVKSIQANGGYALTVLTSITAQNTRAVVAAFDLPVDLITRQLEAVFEDFDIAAVKTGMLSSPEIVETVCRFLAEREVEKLVVDPVMISKSGYRLLQDAAVRVVRERLLPLALLVTPNRHEAQLLAGMEIHSEDDVREAGLRILETGCQAVLLKGGHLEGSLACVDYLVTPRGLEGVFPGERIETRTTHGTGCTYSAALATWLGKGAPLEEAIAASKQYVTEAIRHGLEIGAGHGPTDHFWFLREEPREERERK
ncbi:MAG: bifunctional hydroxymethylpyrimidine kinase/phosphomethylpyrimidine kinase [Candidatus Eisenbacteria bacterium]|nr:bifunctional hydroxymethylpyrimidine kinase/phosphomethylpyrimidine kinase [Candidatus Eisenbacteria bacterium]